MKKLMLSLSICVLLLISFVSSTFAFVVINKTVGVEEFDFSIEGQSGLLISLDGETFTQDISADELKKKISGSLEKFDSTQFTGVTLKHTEDKKIEYNAGQPVFVKDYIQDNLHTFTNANKNEDYISFDIWIKPDGTGMADTEYKISFTEKTGIRAEDYTTRLSNRLTTPDKIYESGEEITINPANAMRLGVLRHITEENRELTVYECTAKGTSAADLGSVAIEGGTGRNNPATNAMFTYYNNLHPLYPFISAAEADLEGFSEEIIQNDYVSEPLEILSYTESGYKVAHFTIIVWLEGWDADYFTSVPTSSIYVNLEFELTV